MKFKTRITLYLIGGILPLLTESLSLWWLFKLPTLYLFQVLAFYASVAIIVSHYAPVTASRCGLNTANQITLFRTTLILPLAGLVLNVKYLNNEAYWVIICIAILGMILDGVDGAIARRTGNVTAFGARFDMELDAFLLLILSLLVWRSSQTGIWIILIGIIRYLFVIAGYIWPQLQGELPANQRAKIICVVQGIILLFCLGPITPSGVASTVAAMALALLMYSFWIDIRWLLYRQVKISNANKT